MYKILALSIALCLQTVLLGQGIDFHHITWEEALELAKKEEKTIFIDCYTTWCGPCKRMSKNVFTQTKVGDFYNKNFINLKLDMEKGEGRKFGQKYPVSAYPTLYYISAKGEIVHSVRGGRSVDAFIELGKKALKLNDNSGDYAAEYEKGNREPELILKYIKALNKAGKPSLKIANEYLRSQKDLSIKENSLIILESTTEADSYIFGLLIKNRKAVEKVSSVEKVQERIERACKATARKAIEFDSQDLLEEAWQKMKKNYPEKSGAFVLETQMNYSLATKNKKTYLKAAKKYAKKEIAQNPDALAKLAMTIVRNYKDDPKAMKLAETAAKQAAEVSGKYDYDLMYAGILAEAGKKEEAIAVAEKALEKAKKVGKKASQRVQMLLKQLKK